MNTKLWVFLLLRLQICLLFLLEEEMIIAYYRKFSVFQDASDIQGCTSQQKISWWGCLSDPGVKLSTDQHKHPCTEILLLKFIKYLYILSLNKLLQNSDLLHRENRHYKKIKKEKQDKYVKQWLNLAYIDLLKIYVKSRTKTLTDVNINLYPYMTVKVWSLF